MNLNELKENVRTGGIADPLAVKECLYRIGSSRVFELVKDPEAANRLMKIKIQDYPDLHKHSSIEICDKMTEISNILPLNYFIDRIAKTCGGSMLRPYLDSLKLEAEKFREYSFPDDVQHSEKPEGENWEIWARDAPDIEPECFAECDDGQVVYNESFAVSDSGCGFMPAYIEAPAPPIPYTNKHGEGTFPGALKNSSEFDAINDILRSLLFITV